MSRNENTREKVQRKVVRFEIRQIRQHFEESLCAIHAQFTVADDLWHSGKKEEAENIWRAQIIFLASAFDFYMHELTKYGLCEIYEDYYFSRGMSRTTLAMIWDFQKNSCFCRRIWIRQLWILFTAGIIFRTG